MVYVSEKNMNIQQQTTSTVKNCQLMTITHRIWEVPNTSVNQSISKYLKGVLSKEFTKISYPFAILKYNIDML